MTDSSWKKDANRRRNVRQGKPEDSPVKVPNKTKDTRRWCRGKVGVEHEPKCMPWHHSDGQSHNRWSDNWRELVCTKCGKVLAYYYPVLRSDSAKKPAWVDQ